MAQMRVLENEKLKIQVSDDGAELCSVYDKVRGREALWTADPKYWARHAPVLFPFVGKVNGGHYTCLLYTSIIAYPAEKSREKFRQYAAKVCGRGIPLLI